jgi:hypothetical protein
VLIIYKVHIYFFILSTNEKNKYNMAAEKKVVNGSDTLIKTVEGPAFS